MIIRQFNEILNTMKTGVVQLPAKDDYGVEFKIHTKEAINRAYKKGKIYRFNHHIFLKFFKSVTSRGNGFVFEMIQQLRDCSGACLEDRVSFIFDVRDGVITLAMYDPEVSFAFVGDFKEINITLKKAPPPEKFGKCYFVDERMAQNFINADRIKLLSEMIGVVCHICFLQFAQIETKILAPKQKLKQNGRKILNKTDSQIIYVDSTWYTNLLVSGAFNVSGHWRLQPCGPGLTERRMIWIKDFKKMGYKRKAKKLEHF